MASGTRPRAIPASVPPIIRDASVETLPNREVTRPSVADSASIATATGISAMVDSRLASDASFFTASMSPAAACRLIRGIIAVSTETPRMP